REPDGDRYYPLANRLTFAGANLDDPTIKNDPDIKSTFRSPIQKFRWVHFPRFAQKNGLFDYRVTPIFMSETDELRHGESQTASIRLARETYPGELNVAFTRGFVSSQAFVDRYGNDLSRLLPPSAAQGLDFVATDPKSAEALPWMGFEARQVILDLLDEAIAD